MIALTVFGLLILAAIVASTFSKEAELTGLLGQVAKAPTGMVNQMKDVNDSGLPVLAQAMPEFQGITKWWNTADGKALTTADLKGKVVLIDFWTYSCINCVRTFPFIKAMHERYADKGLVIVGVHTPEFAFEADPKNVEREIASNGFKHVVALDPKYTTWNAYGNRYWPAGYFFDRQGRLRHTHFGEGAYDENEEVIRKLLEESGEDLADMGPAVASTDPRSIGTHETYFGSARSDAFSSAAPKDNVETSFTLINPKADEWSAGGRWVFQTEYAQANSIDAQFRFNVQAKKLHIVMESADGKDKMIEIFVDGKKTGEMKINESDIYTIAEFPDGGRHLVEIKMKEGGVRLYAATFS